MTGQPGEFVPLTVIATLQQGAALDARFGTALDGLLVAQLRAAAKRSHPAAADGRPVPGSLLDGGQHVFDPPDIDLPLGRCGRAGAGEWHWMATTAQALGHDLQPAAALIDVHHRNTRHDHRTAETAAVTVPATVPPTYGRFRSRRMPVITTPAAALRWRAVGDPSAIAALLTNLDTVGAHRASGEGTVLHWQITTDAHGDADQWGHLHADGSLGRPVPEQCATAHGMGDHPQGTAGIRPPYWHLSRQRTLTLPHPPSQERHHAPS